LTDESDSLISGSLFQKGRREAGHETRLKALLPFWESDQDEGDLRFVGQPACGGAESIPAESCMENVLRSSPDI
jgi:hypothetical protein